MRRAVVFIAGILFAAALLAQGVKDLDKAFVKAAKAGDIEAIVKLYAPDATLYMPDEMMAKGTEAIRESFRKFFEPSTVTDMTLTYESSQASGNLAVASGRFKMTTQPKAGGEPQTMEGRFTSVAVRKGGKWMYVVDHASMPIPPAPPAK
jgi:uncharacterized protein (TIGR02246 family)